MKKINELELKEIFNKLKDGDKNAIELLYKNYHDIVYGIAFSILRNKDNSEDITQNVFTKLLRIEKDQLPSKGEASWLYTVTKNEVFQFLRKQKNIVDIDDLYTIESENNEIDNIVDMTSYYNLLQDLKPIDQEIISLRILSDFTFDKIAQMLNMPIGTVEWRYYKSLHNIKLSLSNLAAFVVVFTVWNLYKAETNSVNEISSSEKNTVKNSTSSGDVSMSFESISSFIDSASYSKGTATSISNIIATICFSILSLLLIILTVFFAIKKKIKIKK